jgi:hypothetical protein
MNSKWRKYVSVAPGPITLLIFILAPHYLGPLRFRIFRDLFAIGFGLALCVFHEDAARSAAQPNKWFGRKDTSEAIPLYSMGFIVCGSVFAIGALVDLLFAFRSRL